MNPTPAAWRNIREPKLVRSEPPHKDYRHLWEPLFTAGHMPPLKLPDLSPLKGIQGVGL